MLTFPVKALYLFSILKERLRFLDLKSDVSPYLTTVASSVPASHV